MRILILAFLLVACDSHIAGYRVQEALEQCKAHGGIAVLTGHANDRAEVSCVDGTHYIDSSEAPK